MKSGLLGNNIKYSLSPSIHNKYYEQFKIPLNYKLFDVENSELGKFIITAKEEVVGFNVTIPYKEVIINFLDELAYPANKIKAVNTVLNKNGVLIGYNTDYYGFMRSLQEKNIDLQDKSVLIIGGGGAAKAVLYAVKDLKAKNIDFVLRNKNSVKEHLKYINNILDIKEKIDLSKYYIVINCTPIGGANHVGETPIHIEGEIKDTIFYDLNYNPEITKFLELAKDKGAKFINGYSMLLNQAYESIDIWKNNYMNEDTES